MSEETGPLLDAVTALVPRLLETLDVLVRAHRHLHPPDLPGIAAALAERREPLAEGLAAFRAARWPPGLTDFRDLAVDSAGHALAALDAFAASTAEPNPVLPAYRALGRAVRAQEALYPAAAVLPPVSRFFLNERGRRDADLAARLMSARRDGTGVMHAHNATGERGGFSVYVPETYDPGVPAPLVVALHGGSGHGRSFLWSWLPDARSEGCILVTPTSAGDTWALMDPEPDATRLHAVVEEVARRWHVDRARVLLTGMSDGGTFSYLAGLREDSPFTHLAPVAAAFHPLLLDGVSGARVAGLPVYVVHGALDWMFPVEAARQARDALTAAGAAVTYRELADLSHTYPREENARLLEWLTQPR
jgi:phospholipase/carboxylesterase